MTLFDHIVENSFYTNHMWYFCKKILMEYMYIFRDQDISFTFASLTFLIYILTWCSTAQIGYVTCLPYLRTIRIYLSRAISHFPMDTCPSRNGATKTPFDDRWKHDCNKKRYFPAKSVCLEYFLHDLHNIIAWNQLWRLHITNILRRHIWHMWC